MQVRQIMQLTNLILVSFFLNSVQITPFYHLKWCLYVYGVISFLCCKYFFFLLTDWNYFLCFTAQFWHISNRWAMDSFLSPTLVSLWTQVCGLGRRHPACDILLTTNDSNRLSNDVLFSFVKICIFMFVGYICLYICKNIYVYILIKVPFYGVFFVLKPCLWGIIFLWGVSNASQAKNVLICFRE